MIGRRYEVKELNRLYDKNRAELVAVYGRRRIGKTYLIDETFEGYIKIERAFETWWEEKGMGEWLPGTPKERLKETRKAKRFSQKKVADFLGIDKATYGRIESGEIRMINSDCLIRLADLYGTTTDYLLGLSDVPERTYYDVERLALLDAARGYDETKGAKFTTYAYMAIRNAMSDLWEEHKKSFEREKQKEGMFPIFLNDGKSNWVSTEGSIGEAALSGRGTDVNHKDRVGDQAVHEVTLEKMCSRFNGLPLR